ncbi:zeta toxin family protein [Sinomonas atrocyanea]
MRSDGHAAAHRAHLERLCADGGPLTAHSRHATTQNPEWFNVRRQQPRAERRTLHNEILAVFVAANPQVRRDRRAIVLAGPPGAGKSTALAELVARARIRPEHWLPVDPDHFKDALLQQALADGSYESYLVPEEVRELEAAGERFWPRELASLVHNESSILAKKAIRDALERGDNLIIDGTLSGEKNARAQFEALEAAGYEVMLSDVETTQEISEARTLGRWERGYLAAEDGQDAVLGGRWVPLSIPASLYTEPAARESVCAANAATIAKDFGCVSEYALYRVADAASAPVPAARKGRASRGGPLVDGETLDAVRAAATARPVRPTPQPRRDTGRSH